MVQLRICEECAAGRHERCMGGMTVFGEIGGWICTCGCNKPEPRPAKEQLDAVRKFEEKSRARLR